VPFGAERRLPVEVGGWPTAPQEVT